jgi:hypothetical protein
MLVGKALISLAGIMLCLLLAVGPASAENFSRVDRQPTAVNNQQTVISKDVLSSHDYHGYLRVYVSQPVSDFRNDVGQNQLHGVIGYPVDMEISLTFPDTLRGDASFDSEIDLDSTIYMTANNIEVIGAVYEFAGHQNYSDPPSGAPFTAHWVDAAAVATPGNPGVDAATPPYTHNVFVEYATRYS